ncbi:MAG: T9SS type A sorting domain-containing protein [Candidatus Kapabacteria bacterium]|nr:T9SS type A sorting domain-containing protein [Candidatus Kapabacteria bacterium]
MMLLKMLTTPTAGTPVYYAGWHYYHTNEPHPSLTMFHFPNDIWYPMKISRDNGTNAFPCDLNGTFNSNGLFWQWNLAAGENYVDESSAGAPLFNGAHEIVGQLYLPGSSYFYTCGGGTPPYMIGGRFSKSWLGGGSSSTRLYDYLYPGWTPPATSDISCPGFWNGGSTELTRYGEQINEENIYSSGSFPFISTFNFYNYGPIVTGSGGPGNGGYANEWRPYILMIDYNGSPVYTNEAYPIYLKLNVNLVSQKYVHIKPCSFITAGVKFHAYIDCSQPYFMNNNSGGTIFDYNYLTTNFSTYSGLINYPPRDSTLCNYLPTFLNNNNVKKFESLSQLPQSYNIAESLDAIPNPTDASIKIKYAVSQPSFCNITVSNNLGEVLSTVVDSPNIKTGSYSVDFDTSKLPAGTYFITMRTLNNTITKQIVVIH